MSANEGLVTIAGGSDGVSAQLHAIDQRLARIERWMERHDAAHDGLIVDLHAKAITSEARLGRLEGSVQVRSIIGGLGLAVNAVLTALGIRVQ